MAWSNSFLRDSNSSAVFCSFFSSATREGNTPPIQIEELTKLYLEKEKELSNRLEQEKKLQEEVERLSDLTEYKKSFTSLKRDYDALLKKEQNTAEEFESLRKEFDQAIEAYEEEQ